MADPQEKQGEWIRTGQIDTTKSDIDDIDALKMKQTQPPGPPSIRDEKMPPVMPIPPAPAVTTQGHGRELSNLAKMYTEESKYSGENDNFDFKLTVFHDICSRADIPEEAKAKAFPTMLRGLALDYYYSNIANSTQIMTFNDICYSIRAYFEGAEYKR
ncbi:hypothetical protein LPUS_03717 [Lasallia pustulata]|uniref:Uncharacterized protein n=1 Tax=Lasallia pustulata TaxID=136370 RepID=A0A1W5CV62_9LECA|nr:hypothetical protein LPUS_03717 [Lasallia pustulata]